MSIERLFPTFKGSEGTPGGYDPADPESYETFIEAMIKDSIDYEGTTLARARDTAQRYYYGYLPNLSGDDLTNWGGPVVDPTATLGEILDTQDLTAVNKSTFVSTDVRDAVMLTLPSLIRLFAASENVVYLTPRTQTDIDIAQQQTDYINYTFWQDNPGFLILYGAFKDALTVKTGYVKWWTDDNKETKRKTWVNLNAQQINMLQQSNPTAKVVHLGQLNPLDGTYDRVVMSYEVSKPIIKVSGVPPEEMRLDRNARSFATSRIVGHERIVPIDELVAMGYDRELCLEYVQGQNTPEFTMENQLRNPGRYTSTRAADGVMYGEWYIRADKDGDGVAELRYICTMGESHKIVMDEYANRVKFAVFSCDPISHTIVGDSLADYTMDMQRIKTNMLRGVLDSLAESINPKTVVNELTVNLDDALNDDLGAVIRTRGDPANAVQFAVTPFAGQQAMPIIDALNDVLARRTGLTDAAKGLDPKALQSSTQVGVDAIINGAQERIELIARVLAETGFKDLFIGLYNEISEAPNQQRTMRLNGKWVGVDTSTFDATMGVEVNSTLGKGSDQTRLAVLENIKQTQQMIMTQFGVSNPVCGIQQFLNTITDQLAIGNIKNVGRYFMTPDPQTLQNIAAQPKEPDAMTIAARAQFEKVKSESAQAIGDQQLKMQKQAADEQYRQEALRQKAIYDAGKLQVDQERLQREHQQADVKTASDLYKAELDAATKRHAAEQQAKQPQGDGNG
jgi:hypothetical protein